VPFVRCGAVKLQDPEAYYADRSVEHTAQGDIHAGIPLVQATHNDASFEAAGARKRPGGPDPDHATQIAFVGLAVVLHYTCGITAQPPGTRGYSHEHRLMAPIVSLRDLRRWGIGNNELRKIRDGRTIQGFMYLPQTGAVQLDSPEDGDDEWSGHAAALVYRPASVTQTLLDHQPRIARLTADATRILNAAIVQTYTPNNFEWESLAEPDMSDGWASE
jgi:hypothetical protein